VTQALENLRYRLAHLSSACPQLRNQYLRIDRAEPRM
jgi:hypothetical protein